MPCKEAQTSSAYIPKKKFFPITPKTRKIFFRKNLVYSHVLQQKPHKVKHSGIRLKKKKKKREDKGKRPKPPRRNRRTNPPQLDHLPKSRKRKDLQRLLISRSHHPPSPFKHSGIMFKLPTSMSRNSRHQCSSTRPIH